MEHEHSIDCAINAAEVCDEFAAKGCTCGLDTEHSELPWKMDSSAGVYGVFDRHNDLICRTPVFIERDAEGKANAHFIVKACNQSPAFEAMREALEKIANGPCEAYEGCLVTKTSCVCPKGIAQRALAKTGE